MENINVYVLNEENADPKQEEAWDDVVLVKAFDKTLKGIKRDIAQRIGMLNGTLDECNGEKITVNSDVKVQKSASKKRQRKKWKVGDYCRAVFSNDGIEYEAEIIDLFCNGTCIVRYSGYGNEELVEIRNLKSLGEGCREAQKNITASSLPQDSDPHVSNYNEASSGNSSMPQIPFSPSVTFPPPPGLQLPYQMRNETGALSAMLMSWYMSGYHTGYYQGLVQGKKQSEKLADCKK